MSGLSRGNPVAKHKKMTKKQLFNNKCLCKIRDRDEPENRDQLHGNKPAFMGPNEIVFPTQG